MPVASSLRLPLLHWVRTAAVAALTTALALPAAAGARPVTRGATPVRPQPDSAAAIIDRAARAFKAAKTVRATFEQTLNNPATGTEAKATGDLVLAQPNRIAVRFTQPAGDRVVSDGTTLWVYLPSAAPGQVIKLPVRGRGAAGVDALGDMLTSPRSKYAVSSAGTATLGGRATHAVLLTPKAESAPIAKATVWVDDADGAVRQIQLTDANGLVRTLRMTTWTPNARVPASTFAFTVPAGVRVVDEAALRGAR